MGAQRWRDAFAAAIDRLADNPLACGKAPERFRPTVDILQILFKTSKGKYYRAVLPWLVTKCVSCAFVGLINE
jgi:hypothetical protein